VTTPTRYLVLAGGLLGLGAVALALVARDGRLTIADPDPAALRGPRAAIHEELERRESALPGGLTNRAPGWQAHLHVVQQELERGRIDAAVRMWHDAYAAALESRTWEGMIDVGDAFMAIGRAAGTPSGARRNARDAYMVALIRARREGSIDGVLRSTEAFAQIDERVVVEQCLVIADRLAAGDEQAQRRVREARQRWAGRSTATDVETEW
jgi:hypothetical protein